MVAATGAETVAGAAGRRRAPGAGGPSAVERRRPGRVGDCRARGDPAAGHTPGSIALLYDDPDGTPHLFTGDSLFPGGVGKTSSPDDFASLVEDVSTKLFDRLPDETWFYPGHGDDSTLGAERPHLAEWRERGW